MRQVYHISPQGNFGDDLNAWFWDTVLPGWRDWDESVTLIGIGTILNADLLPSGKKLVIGSGAGYGKLPDISDAGEWDIRAVRGPGTTNILGLDPSKALCDPAIILPCLERFQGIERTDDIVFVPHVGSDSSYDWASICRRIGLQYQSPSASPDIVIKRLASARRVIAESMHAAIIADAFGTPWTAVQISRGFNRFKWQDWAESLEIRGLEVQNFFPVLRRMQSLANSMKRKRTGHETVNKPMPSNRIDARRKGFTLQALAYMKLQHVNRKARFRVSDRHILGEAQKRYFKLFDDIQRDYHPRSG